MSTKFRAPLAALALTAFLAGCWNGENIHLRMGDVSIGQQLIDLKRALDEEAISEEEYAQLRLSLMQMAEVCGNQKSLQGTEPD